jgi:hypothetical protein
MVIFMKTPLGLALVLPRPCWHLPASFVEIMPATHRLIIEMSQAINSNDSDSSLLGPQTNWRDAGLALLRSYASITKPAVAELALFRVASLRKGQRIPYRIAWVLAAPFPTSWPPMAR